METRDEKKQTLQLKGFILIQHQILMSSRKGNVWPLVKRITIQFLGVHRWNKLNSHNMRNEQWFQMHTILSLTTLDQRKKTKGLNGIHGLFFLVTLATIEIIWNKLLHYFSSVNMSVKDARTCNSLHLIREKLAEMSKAKWNKLKK